MILVAAREVFISCLLQCTDDGIVIRCTGDILSVVFRLIFVSLAVY